MLTHREFSAWIVADGEALPEYLVAVDTNAHRVSCWIPSQAGQTFAVYWRDHGGKVDTCGFITLDGFVVPGRFLFGEGIAWRQGVRTSASTERPFVFQKIEDTVSESSAQAVAKDVGMVILRIKRVDRISSRPANAIQEIPRTTLGKRKVGDLYVGFGEEEEAHEQYTTTWSVKPHDQNLPGAGKSSTYVTFIFRYRSREFLESQGISTEPEVTHTTPTKPPVRRVVSMPSSMPSPETPSPSPERKKSKLMTTPFHTGPHRLRNPPLEMRRAVSWKLTQSTSIGFPGEALRKFDQESEKQQVDVDDPGESSTVAGVSEAESKE